MSLGSYSFIVQSEYDGVTARSYLRRICGLTARSMTVLKSVEEGVTRNGVLLRARDVLRTGDHIELHLPAEVNEIAPVEGSLDILHEDEYLLVVNKPPCMPVHPTKVHQLDTLANLVAYFQHHKGESYTFRALNRLDKDTSGCVMIAKDRLTYALVQPTVTKRYVAVCEGILISPGVIDSPIALEPGSKIKRCLSPDGKSAVTYYTPIRCGNGHTLLELRLLTGRTHQIRCHMSGAGYPLAGDDLYGGSRRYINRQALHCYQVAFIHPVTKEPVTLQTEIPQEFAAILDSAT